MAHSLVILSMFSWFTFRIISSECNLYDGNKLQNNGRIQTTQNHKIGNFNFTDPLIISFDFILDGTCDTALTESTICNLIHIGTAFTTFRQQSSQRKNIDAIYFPKISVQYNVSGRFSWLIQIGVYNMWTNNDSIIHITNDTVNVPINEPSTISIHFSGNERQIYIGTQSFYSNDDSTNADIWPFVLHNSQSFYVSSPVPNVDSTYDPALSDLTLTANISNMCIYSNTEVPTNVPTNIPSLSPTQIPTVSPTLKEEATLSPTPYEEINCYTESGNAGDESVRCSRTDYIITSCGVDDSGNIANHTILFNKGGHIERESVNDLSTDGICYIDHNTKNGTLRANIVPKARCCYFQQQFNEDFRCRYFESDFEWPNKIVQSSGAAATKRNGFSYVKCNDEFPIMLSCTAQVSEINPIQNPNFAETNGDIQFFGAFQTDAIVNDSVYNTYFEWNTGSIIETTEPTSSPTDEINPLNLNVQTKCVAQYGRNNGSFTVRASATCCTNDYGDSSVSELQEPTSKPTKSPTFSSRIFTDYYGPSNTFTKIDLGDSFDAMDGTNYTIAGINKWSLFQIISAEKNDYSVSYQGLLIGEYLTWDGDEYTSRVDASGDYHTTTENFYITQDCASFKVGTDTNGVKDYINGYDVYYTQIAVIGLTFYTSFGMAYSCPDSAIFRDDTFVAMPLEGELEYWETYKKLNETYYSVSMKSEKNVFENQNNTYGIYKLNGWRGVFQTRVMTQSVIRNVYATLGFSFVLDGTVNTFSPTKIPTHAPISKTASPTQAPQSPTLIPTFAIQNNYTNELICTAYFGNKQVECQSSKESMMGCNGYSTEGQIFNSYISEKDECIVSTINDKSVAAIGTCCRFTYKKVRHFQVFEYTLIVCGSMFMLLFIVGSSALFFYIKKIEYFDPEDVDDDTVLDNVIGHTGPKAVKKIIQKAKITVDDQDMKEMLELQKLISHDVGLII